MRHSSWEATHRHHAPGDVQKDADILNAVLGAVSADHAKAATEKSTFSSSVIAVKPSDLFGVVRCLWKPGARHKEDVGPVLLIGITGIWFGNSSGNLLGSNRAYARAFSEIGERLTACGARHLLQFTDSVRRRVWSDRSNTFGSARAAPL